MLSFQEQISQSLSSAQSFAVRMPQGRVLRGRWWWPDSPPSAAVLALHGLQSNSRWFARSAAVLREAGIGVLALDRCGSGESDGPPAELGADIAELSAAGHWPSLAAAPATGYRGHVLKADDLLAEIHATRQALAERAGPGVPLTLLGNCFAVRLALPFLSRHPGSFDRLILTSPGTDMHPRTDLRMIDKFRVIQPLQCACRPSWVRVPLRDEWFTTAPESLAWVRNDIYSLSLRWVSTALLRAARRLTAEMDRMLSRLSLPLLVLLADQDAMTQNEKIERRFKDHWSGPLSVETLHSEHLLEFGADFGRYVGLVQAWVNEPSPADNAPTDAAPQARMSTSTPPNP